MGAVALILLLAFVVSAFAALLLRATAGEGLDASMLAYIGRVLRFTLLQAIASTMLAVAPALFVARALARRADFTGRSLLLRLFALPLALPAIVAVLGIVEIWGQQGYANRILQALGMGRIDIYGLGGILLAHVFFNLPLAARLFLTSLERVPGESWRLAAQLGFGSRAIWRLIEWPVLRAQLPAIAGLVFMLCLTSFTIVLTLGGGPRATTIEVAIYQALRFDFDVVLAMRLSLLQLLLTATVVILGIRVTQHLAADTGLDRRVVRSDAAAPGAIMSDAAWIAAAAALTVPVLAAIVAGGFAAPLGRLVQEAAVWRAVRTSLSIAAIAALVSIFLAWPLAELSATAHGPRAGRLLRALGRLADLSGSLVLVMPPVVLGAGWFVLLIAVPGGRDMAFAVVVAINALMAVPFVLRILAPAVAEARMRHDRLCAGLGLAGWARLRLIDWPTLRRPLGIAAAFALALSLGDLGAIALFGSEDLVTLPFLLLQRLGAYRVNDAAGIALFLGLICLIVMALAERAAGRIARL